MDPDITTSAKDYRDLPTIVRAARAGQTLASLPPANSNAPRRIVSRHTFQALARSVRATVESLRARIRTLATTAPANSETLRDLDQRCIEIAARSEAAVTHVLGVRARLSELEQRLFDDLVRDGAVAQVITVLVRKTEDEAVAFLRHQLLAIEPVLSAAALARRIGTVRGELTNEEYDRAIMRLPHMPAADQRTLYEELRGMSAISAAALVRITVLGR